MFSVYMFTNKKLDMVICIEWKGTLFGVASTAPATW